MPIKLTLEEAKNEFLKRGYKPLFNEYTNSKAPLEYQCPKHPEIIRKIALTNLKSGQGCWHCGRERVAEKERFSIDEIRKEFVDRGLIPLFTEYINSKQPLAYRCPKHPEKLQYISYDSFKRQQAGCGICRYEKVGDKLRKDINEVKEEFRKRGYEPLFTEYKTRSIPLPYRCPNHPNKETKIALSALLAGKGCKYCASERSQSEGCNKIERFLQTKELNYQKEYSFSDCRYKHILKYDFAIFNNQNNLMLLIEFNGKQHYEEKSQWGNNDIQKDRDKVKVNYCKKNNINLLIIPYTEEENIESILTKEILDKS